MSQDKDQYDINIGESKKLDSADIKKHMDFDAAYDSYSHWVYRHPWYKFQLHSPRNRKVVMMMILFGVIAALVFMESDLNDLETHAPIPVDNSDSLKSDSIDIKSVDSQPSTID